MASSRRHRRAAALWGGTALVVLGAGIGVTLNLTTAAAAGSSGAGTASSGNQRGGGNNGGGIGNTGSTTPAKALTVRPSAPSTLAPGTSTTVTAAVTNGNSSAVKLTALSGRVTSVTPVGGAECRIDWFVFDRFAGTLPQIPAGATRALTLTLRFNNLDRNQDGCKGAAYGFSVTALGDQVVR